MSSVELIPDDLLRVIFIVSSDASVEQKFSVSQVCRRWPLVALSTPHLWCLLRLYSVLDFRRVTLALQRTGSFVILDVDMLGPFFMPNHGSHLEAALSALIPYTARLRTLKSAWPSEALLGSGLHFPILETLRVKGPREDWGTECHLSAPALKVLDLERMRPLKLEQLLYTSLERLRLSLCFDVAPADIQLVLERCTALVELTFHVRDAPRPAPRFGPIHDKPHMPALATLDLRLHLTHMVDVLDAFTGLTPVRAVSACTPRGSGGTDLRDVCAPLVRDLAPLVSFEVEDPLTIVLRDDAGRVRTLAASSVHAPWPVADVWAHLAHRYHANETIREISFPLEAWPELVVALGAYPPLAQSGVLLRIVAPDGLGVPDAVPETAQLAIPGLQRVEFCGGVGGGAPAPETVARILRVLTWTGDRRIEVAFDKRFSDAARAQVEQENSGRWELVSCWSRITPVHSVGPCTVPP